MTPPGDGCTVAPSPAQSLRFARAADGYSHPSSEEELCDLVRAARRAGRNLRVRGAAHSVAPAIATDGRPGDVDVLLDRYVAMTFDEARMRVTAQAGCHLGVDPRDPTRSSWWGNSLLAQLDDRGWALPDLGGVTHQTVSGFLATGSCGGTVIHDIEEAVVAYRVIDGTGEVRTVDRGDERFDAMGCSLGLLGVISTVTFQCVPRYDVIGREDICDETSTPFAMFEDGDAGLEGFLRRTEYARLMWWPQDGVRRVATWAARRMRPSDYDPRTGPPGRLKPRTYSALGIPGESPMWTSASSFALQAAGGLFYDGLAEAARRFEPISRSSPVARAVGGAVRRRFARHVLPSVLRPFVGGDAPQHFWDGWCHGLPLDNQISEASFPTEFTEIFVPLDRTGEAIRALRAHYDRFGYDATGPFVCEIYAAGRRRAWMHPAYDRDSLRIDLFWFARNPGDPRRTYFAQFWRLLRPFAYRLHWGKHLPLDPELGHRHLRRHTPRWDDFLALRARLDPDGVFLTRYWRAALGLDA